MRAGRCLRVALALMLLSGCGGTDSPQTSNPVTHPNDPTPPAPAAGGPYLEYDRPLVFTVGMSASLEADGVGADVTVTISPALPDGLSLDARTGTISGTPTALSPGQSYTLTAVNARGTTTRMLSLEVNDGPLFYSSPALLSVGTPMMPLTPSGTRFLSGYSITPALPAGLSLDPVTGVISGTPTVASPPTYYRVTGADAGFGRAFGLTLGVVDPSVSVVQGASAPYDCTHSGGFVGTYSADAMDGSYGQIAIAFTPDGHAHARVSDLSGSVSYDPAARQGFHDSDALGGLGVAMDGSFSMAFPGAPEQSLSGRFMGPDLITGTYQRGLVTKPFAAARLGGSASATYRYTGGFGTDNGYRLDFGTVDVTGSTVSGAGYQMGYSGPDYVLINRQLLFGATISGGLFTINVDMSITQHAYVPGQGRLIVGDPYDGLFTIETYGCRLN